MFQIDESWECFRGLGAVLDEPGLHTYRCVEVAANGPLFHVDFHENESSEPGWAWSRLVCTQLADVLDLLARDDISTVQLSIQTPLDRDGYRLFAVAQIAKVRLGTGADAFLFLGLNGERYCSENLALHRSVPADRQIVWERKAEHRVRQTS